MNLPIDIKKKRDKSLLEKIESGEIINKLWNNITHPYFPIDNNYFIITPKRYNTDILTREILNLNENWVKKDIIADSWESITLKSINGEDQSFLIKSELKNGNENMYKYTDIIDKLPNIKKILDEIPSDIYLVRLLKLRKGKKIKYHTDEVVFNEREKIIRVHLPIITDPKIIFKIGYPLQKPGEGYYIWNAIDLHTKHLNEGYLWCTNVNTIHGVENNSEIDRIHLVIDMKPIVT